MKIDINKMVLTTEEYIDALADMDMTELSQIAGVDPVKAEQISNELSDFLGLENVTTNNEK